jgi:predicted phage tail component-like protein
MLSFNFGGKDSFIDYGIIVSSRPTLPTPKRRVSFIDIPGRNSNIRFDEGTYEDVTIVLECTIKRRNNIMEQIDNIKAWLFGSGETDLTFSFQPDKKYRAQAINAIDFKQVFKYISKFPVIFNCRPFKYSTENSVLIINQSGEQVINPGTIESEPVISIFASGDVALKINGEQINLVGIVEKITVNSEIQGCYDDGGDNKNEKMVGEFPKLKSGTNIIEWIGNVSKVEILPNWRWI